MERKTAADFPPQVLELFDGYVHGRLSRREFLDRAARFAVGTFGAAAMLEALSPNFARAEQVKPADPRIATGRVDYPSPRGSGTMRGYLAKPSTTGRFPAVVVVHENRGLNPYIEDVARRLAVAGYLAFAPDALAPLGGYPGDEDRARELFAKLDPAMTAEDMDAAIAFLKSRSESAGKWGAVGFCWGGGMVNRFATRFPDMGAGVPYYGAQPKPEDAARIKAPLMLHYASEDKRITGGWPAFESVLKAHHVPYEAHVYPNTQHGFHNDTTPRYDEAAATLSWERTLGWFRKYLA